MPNFSYRSNCLTLKRHHMKTLIISLFTFLLTTSLSFSQAPVVIWQHAFGGSEDETAGDFKRTSYGGLIVCGTTKSKNGDVEGNMGSYTNFWIFKLDVNHNLVWSKTYGGTGNDAPNSICEIS